MVNLLKNGDFEGGDWRKTFDGREFGEISLPQEWVAFWKEGGVIPHDPDNHDGYRRPECKVIGRVPPFLDPPRIHADHQAWLCFTFFGIHDAGLYQQVRGLTPEARVRATFAAHAWSSQQDDAHISDDAGNQAYFAVAGTPELSASQRNFTFSVGIDPNGGVDPWAASVVWGPGAHIYNVYASVPPVEAVVGAAGVVTVFLRSSVLWRFKHCDAYFDAAELVLVADAPGADVSLELLPAKPTRRQLFKAVARNAGQVADLRLAFAGGDVLRGDPHVQGADVVWQCMALAGGDYVAQVLRGAKVLAEQPLHVAVPASAKRATPQ